jgi:hypothetical protein
MECPEATVSAPTSCFVVRFAYIEQASFTADQACRAVCTLLFRCAHIEAYGDADDKQGIALQEARVCLLIDC